GRVGTPDRRYTMAEKARPRAKGQASSNRTSGTREGQKGGSSRSEKGSSPRSASGSSHASSNGRGSVSIVEAVQSGRDHLGLLLGRPVEAVLGVDREQGNWVLRAQVLE